VGKNGVITSEISEASHVGRLQDISSNPMTSENTASFTFFFIIHPP
jgi:hypothetical protein